MSSLLTCGDIFSGGGGWSLGAIAAGLRPLWAIEHDAAIAECYRRNVGDHVIVADARAVDIAKLAPVDVLLASPPSLFSQRLIENIVLALEAAA